MDLIGIVWIVLIVFFATIEAFTMQLISIWFTAGALAAGIAYLLNADPATQTIIFFAVSIGLMLVTRPLAKKMLKGSGAKTNADRIIDEVGVVVETIDNINGKGRIKIKSELWAARNLESGIVEPGTEVMVVRIEGVKAMVTPVRN